jgi:hypothetical protein
MTWHTGRFPNYVSTMAKLYLNYGLTMVQLCGRPQLGATRTFYAKRHRSIFSFRDCVPSYETSSFGLPDRPHTFHVSCACVWWVGAGIVR